jgi:hypothetical protein
MAAPASLILRAADGAAAFERINVERPVVEAVGARRVVGARAGVITLNAPRVTIIGSDRTRRKPAAVRLLGLIIRRRVEGAGMGTLWLRVVEIKH